MFVCPICGNANPLYISYLNGRPYCRLCVSFKGKEVEQKKNKKKEARLKLSYQLTEEQKKISKQLIEAISDKKNVLIDAVCGAGKTEIIYGVIKEFVEKGKHVGFAIPRKDVVIELQARFKEAFPYLAITSVYGGHTKNLEGDIILLTTHQLFRYRQYFDLLIIDEVDAFPFKGNKVLNAMFKKAVVGNYVLMSATYSEKDMKQFIEHEGVCLHLIERFHRHPLVVPKYIRRLFTKPFYLIYKLRQYAIEQKPCFIFTPTIEEGEKLFSFLKWFIKDGMVVHSKKSDRNEIIERFKTHKLNYLVTTSILERGVTIKNLQVIIYKADHPLYDCASLVQIAGRVGRKSDAFDGDVILLGDKKTISIKEAIERIRNINDKTLHNLF